jgi:hypothetical protein
MPLRHLFWLVFLWPVPASADPRRDGSDDQRAAAQRSLDEKLAELERLQAEIEHLRKAAGDPQRNVRLRIRLVEVSLTKMKALDLQPPYAGTQDAIELERQMAALIQKSLARPVLDKVLNVAQGSECRFRAGTELPASPQSKGHTAMPGLDVSGTEIAATPREHRDGRLAIELVCNYSRPIIYGENSPQRQVQEISTVVKIAPGGSVVLEGNINQRIESVSRGILPALSRTTDHVNEIQTFIVVSREPRAAGTRTAAVR